MDHGFEFLLDLAVSALVVAASIVTADFSHCCTLTWNDNIRRKKKSNPHVMIYAKIRGDTIHIKKACKPDDDVTSEVRLLKA